MVGHNKAVLALSLFLLSIPILAHAQRTIGVVWQVPSSQRIAEKQLHKFAEAGFTYLQIEDALNSRTWNTINRLGFNVYATLPVYFPTAKTFRQAGSAFYRRMRKLAIFYKGQPSVKAIGLFSYGSVTNASFQKSVADYINRIFPKSSEKLYYLTTNAGFTPVDTLFDFKIIRTSNPVKVTDSNIGAWLYQPPKGKIWELYPVKQFLKQTARSPDIPIFFHSSWLQTMINKHPGFRNILSFYATSSSAVFPIPPNEPAPAGNKIIVIALLIAWILFAFTFRYDPLYQKSFKRFFLSHRFYVSDVIHRNIRTFLRGNSILIQHCIAGGIIYLCIMQSSFSQLGLKALFWHIPVLAQFGTGKLGIFLWGWQSYLLSK